MVELWNRLMDAIKHPEPEYGLIVIGIVLVVFAFSLYRIRLANIEAKVQSGIVWALITKTQNLNKKRSMKLFEDPDYVDLIRYSEVDRRKIVQNKGIKYQDIKNRVLDNFVKSIDNSSENYKMNFTNYKCGMYLESAHNLSQLILSVYTDKDICGVSTNSEMRPRFRPWLLIYASKFVSYLIEYLSHSTMLFPEDTSMEKFGKVHFDALFRMVDMLDYSIAGDIANVYNIMSSIFSDDDGEIPQSESLPSWITSEYKGFDNDSLLINYAIPEYILMQILKGFHEYTKTSVKNSETLMHLISDFPVDKNENLLPIIKISAED